MKAPAGKRLGNHSHMGRRATSLGLLRPGETGAPAHRPLKLAGLLVGALLALLVFGAALAFAAKPTVTAPTASNVEYTTATAEGEIDPSTSETFYFFQYSTQADFSSVEFAGFGSIAAGAGPTPVEAELTGLHPLTTYHLRLFAENAEGSREALATNTFTTTAVAKPTVTIEPVTTFTGTTATFVGHINPNAPAGNPEAFNVNWHFECMPECRNELAGQISADSSSHEVEAQAIGLIPGRTYEVSLVAENAGGEEAAGPVSFATPAIAPSVAHTFVTGVSPSSATLNAEVLPGGAPTTYHFQYISDAAFKADGETFGSGTIETPESTSLGSDETEHLASVPVGDLVPSTAYDFRVVATNGVEALAGPVVLFTTFASVGVEAQNCPNAALRLGPSAILPDCRAYEEVSPAHKGALDVYGEAEDSQSSPSGNAIIYYTLSPLPAVPGETEVEGASEFPTYLASRASGWSTRGLQPPTASLPGSTATNALINGWSEDLRDVLVASKFPALTTGASGTEYATYLDQAGSSGYQNLVPSDPSAETFMRDSTPAGSAFLFESRALEIVPGIRDESESPYLYEWDEAKPVSDHVSFVGLVAGVAPEAGTVAGAGAGQSGAGFYAQNTISNDGSRIFFTDREDERLYLRDTTTEQTVPVSAGPATWRASTPDGAFTFYTEAEQLFRFDVATAAREALTPPASEVLGTLGISSDGSYVYFASKAELAPGGTPGQDNVYLWHEGTVVFVADVSPVPNFTNQEELPWLTAPNLNLGLRHTSRVNTAGTVLLFSARRDVTAYQANENPEWYLYDADQPRSTTNPRCISCNPSGAAATTGVNYLPRAQSGAGPSNIFPLLPRYLSDNGKRVFFQTAEGLSPLDTNGQEDVYEWEAPGEGSCRSGSNSFSSQDGGCIFLISSGRSATRSYIDDASADGSSVFFFTRQQLVGQDQDEASDLYVAREDGGIADQNPAAAPPICSGEACRQQPAAAPQAESPASATFVGPVNPKVKAKHRKKPKHPRRRKHAHPKKHRHGNADKSRKQRRATDRVDDRGGRR